MLNDFIQRMEATIMHVGRGELHVAKRRNGEFSLVAVALGRREPSQVAEGGVQPIIRKSLTTEKWASMAVKAISPMLAMCGIVLRVKELKTLLFLRRKGLLPIRYPVKLRIVGNLHQEELFQGPCDAVGSDFRSAEGCGEHRAVAPATSASALWPPAAFIRT